MTAGNGGAGGGRPARRALGLPGQPRAGEWLEPAPGVPGVLGVAEPVPEAVALPDAAVPAEEAVPPEEAPVVRPVPVPEADGGPGLRAELEAILMVVDEPAGEAHLASVLERPCAEVAAALRELSAEYTAQGRGFDLRLVAGGWRFYSRAACAPAVDRFVLDGQQARLTQAALETLAVVAYRQPVSRSRVSAVRGVNCDGVMRTLVQRGLVEEAGSEPETGAILYRTTNYFLERMGLRGLDELPELAPFLPEVDDVEAESLEGTMIAEAVAAAAVQAADGSGGAGRAAPDR
ncbi:SMC-Scp complex subunit ScpB [Kitasatospora sp. NPDC056184]|uniref:SMC-Scp complex subunit ScpB n=1 Tax=Kitasatospora sp. NPDC056184 TaxID=3345738 RepID=UPI0035D734EC